MRDQRSIFEDMLEMLRRRATMPKPPYAVLAHPLDCLRVLRLCRVERVQYGRAITTGGDKRSYWNLYFSRGTTMLIAWKHQPIGKMVQMQDNPMQAARDKLSHWEG